MELYFEDFSTDLIGNTKEMIDGLMQEIEQSPLMRNPTTISEYSSYQILVAKYTFYVREDIEKALDILYELKSQADYYRIHKVSEHIVHEIQILEAEVSKWSNITLSTQKRIEQSDITSYMQDLLNVIKRDSI